MRTISFIKKITAVIALCFIAYAAIAQNPNLVWSDEFDQAEFQGSTFGGTEPDPDSGLNWHIQEGDGCAYGICGWGNNELQNYREENVYLDGNGNLVILVESEKLPGPNRYNYYSARIRTHKLQEFQYGRIEAYIKLPAGGGLWPAFWTLGADQDDVGWPKCGEIDIMEYQGNNPDKTIAALHYDDVNGNHRFRHTNFSSYDGYKFSGGFHLFAIEWEENEIRWYLDDILFFRINANEHLDADEVWRFNKPHHLLLNVAIGGNLGGTVDNSIFPVEMVTQYVRVYDGPKPTISGNRLVENKATGEEYIVHNAGGASISWSVPQGATITSESSNSITVDFGDTGGDVTATFNVGNGNQTLPIDVTLQPSYAKDFIFANFDEEGQATYLESDGVLTEVSNPAPNTINGSSLSGKYVRDDGTQYDVIFYGTSAITDAEQYSSALADKKFYIDVYTTEAPVGTEILLQLEDPGVATANNWPTGRHSRYVGTITEQGAWHRIPFEFLDRPDPDADPLSQTNIVLLFNSNTFTGDTYYYDNFDSYKVGTGDDPVQNESPIVSITSPANGTSFEEGTTITIEADASDPDGEVSQVEFFVNDNSIGVDDAEPYSVSWTVTVGDHTLTAVATDNDDASTTSSAVSITGTSGGGNESPTVSITSPTDGASFEEGTTISIEAGASDADGEVAQVEFFVNGSSIGVDQTEPYSVSWTVTVGDHTLTAVATDNEGASTTSSAVSITGTSGDGGEEATYIYVESVVTGTANAGAGQKRGTATVTVVDNLGNPYQGALVSGTFSGTFSEIASGTTGSDGKVTMETSGTQRGNVIVNFCVDNVEGSLPWDSSINSDLNCSSSKSQTVMSESGSQIIDVSINLYPNPVKDRMWIELNGFMHFASVRVVNVSGQVVLQKTIEGSTNSIDVSTLPAGVYVLRVNDSKNLEDIKFIK